ncbi:MAG TPA: hypothetical protein VIT22_08175 [Pseudoxanthomonas sp.]
MPSLSRPARGVRVKEPSFGTCLVRGTDHAADVTGKFSRAYYARRQVFNADNTYFFTIGEGWHHLYDAKTMKHLRKLSPRAVNSSLPKEYHINSDSEAQWDAKDPNSMYYLSASGGKKLMKLDVRNNSYKVVADFSNSLPSWASGATRVWAKWEGSSSKDSRYWGFQVENSSGTILGYIVWDLLLNKLAGSMQSSIQSDHTSMSPSGRWIVLASHTSGTWAYSPDFKTKKKLMGTSGHSDLAIGANGHDHYVSIDYASSKGDVFMVDLDTCPSVAASASTAAYCPRTVLFQQYIDGSSSAMHISGKAYDRPGWVVVSAYGHKNSRDGSTPWYADKVFAMEMRANPRIYPIAYTRRTKASTGDSYWSEPHATTNRNLTQIAFNSNWGGSSYEDVDTYIVKLPVSALPGSVVTTPPTRVTGGNTPPSSRYSGATGITSSMKPTTTTAASTTAAPTTVVGDAPVSSPTTWVSPGMRFVRNAVSVVQGAEAAAAGTDLYISRAAIWSLPSVAWLRSVLVDEEALRER